MYKVYNQRATERLRIFAHDDLEKVAMTFEELGGWIEHDLTLLPVFESTCKAKVWKHYDLFKGTLTGAMLLWTFENADWDAVIFEVFRNHFAN